MSQVLESPWLIITKLGKVRSGARLAILLYSTEEIIWKIMLKKLSFQKELLIKEPTIK